MHRVHVHECALGMLQGGMRTADVAKAIHCDVSTVRCLRQRYNATGRQDGQMIVLAVTDHM